MPFREKTILNIMRSFTKEEMTEKFVCDGWKQYIAALFLISFSIFAVNPQAVQAERFIYPAQLDGCVLGGAGLQWVRPTCTESVIAYYNATEAICSQETITEFQAITCTVSGIHPKYGTPWSFTASQAMWPWYVCSYGGFNPAGSSAYNCEFDIDDILPAKNLGNKPNNNSNCGLPEDPTLVGNPIHARTGNKNTVEPDYISPSLTFARHYNSQQNKLDRHIGIKWRHSYNQKLVLSQNDTLSIAFVERPNGKTLIFTPENDLWSSDGDISDQLLELPNGNWQFVTTDDIIEHYDANGNLTSIIDPDGSTQTLSYDSNERLIAVSDNVGRLLAFTYDSSGRIETLTDPAGGVYWYDYDTSGNLVSVTHPDARVRTYHYNEAAYTSGTHLPNALTGITNENNVRFATYSYDTQGRAIITEHTGGANRYTLAYNADTTTITDPLGSVYTRQFQTILGVAKSVSQSQPAGSGCSAAASATTYDINGNVTSRTDFNGNKTCYAIDLTSNLEIVRIEGLGASSACPGDLVNYVPVSDTDERKILTDWHIDFRLPVRVTEAGRETNINYDSQGNVTLLNIRDTASNETRSLNTSYVYHSTVPGVIIQRIEDGPRTDVADITTIDYYAPDENCLGGHFGCRAQISRVTNALDHTTQITRYNEQGQPETITDPNGLTTTLTYDNRQRLVSRIVGAEVTDYQYDGVGQVTHITFPDNSFVAYIYDDAQRLTEITDSLGNTIRYTLDAMGNHTKEEVFDTGNILAQTRSQEFDALSRLWKMTGAQNQLTELAYDANGNLKQTTDPLLHTATRQFDALDRLIQANDPAGGQTSQQHDALDQLAKVTDPKGIETTYTTNALGDVLQEVSKDRGTTNYTYDSAGNLITRTDARGVVETTTYDALNRQTGRTYVTVTGVPNIDPISWTYDSGSNGIGQLTGMSDESGSATYRYDLQGRLLSKIQSVKFGARTFIQTLSYQYDNSGRLSQTTYPSGAQIDTIYGIDGRPAEIRVNGDTLIQNITYQPFGAVNGWTWGNGQTHTRSFDLDGRLTQHPLGSDTQTLTYDAASQIIGTTRTNPVYNRNYEYDALGRLIRQSDNTSFRLWTFDANSNRTSVQSGSTVYPYTLDSNSNRLLSVAGPVTKTYTYDAAGNVLSDGIITYTWNAAGRLRKIVNGNKTRKYKHNGLGERTRRNGANKRRSAFFYDMAGHLISEYKARNIRKENWRLKQETVWLGDIPIAVLKKPVATEPIQIYFVHADHLNTPRLIVDQNNNPVWRWRNTQAFGSNLVNKDPDGDGTKFQYNLRFAGQYFDNETRLHYNYFRDYDPEIGRYVSSDPIGLAGGINAYGYVGNNPVRFIDPTGTIIINAGAAGIGAAIGGVAAGVTAAFQGGSLGNIARATAIGAFAGAATGFTLGAAGTIAVGGLSSGLGSTAGQLVTSGSVDASDVALSFIAGATGGVAGILSRQAGQSAAAQALTSSLATAETQVLFNFKQTLNDAFSPNNGQCK